MQIDWFTFVAQIVNFLILVVLLRWLLYDRIVNAMKEREEKIARRLEEADHRRDEAQDARQRYEEKQQELEAQRDELLKEARQEAHDERQRWMKQARTDVEQQRRDWEEAYRRERDDLLADLRAQAGQLGLAAARHTLSQLADADLESRMCEQFATRLERLDEEQREEITHHLGNGQATVTVRSAFTLTDSVRDRLSRAVHRHLASDAKIAFERTPELLCGLEVNVGGYTFDWNAHEFLKDLESEFDERVRSLELPSG